MKRTINFVSIPVVVLAAIIGLIAGLTVDGGQRFFALFLGSMLYGIILAGVILLVIYIINYIKNKNNKELSDKEFVARANKHKKPNRFWHIFINCVLIAILTAAIVVAILSNDWRISAFLIPLCLFCIGCGVYNIIKGDKES